MHPLINCSVTVMPILENRVGFIKRRKDDSYAELYLAPGGKVEESDGKLIEGVMYYSVEQAAIRELREETGLELKREDLDFFCSLTLPNGRVVISFYAFCKDHGDGRLTFMDRDYITRLQDQFAPGMAQEALMLLQYLALTE